MMIKLIMMMKSVDDYDGDNQVNYFDYHITLFDLILIVHHHLLTAHQLNLSIELLF